MSSILSASGSSLDFSLLLLLLEFCNLLLFPSLSIPQSSLQNQDTHQNERQNGVARSQHLQAVFSVQNNLAFELRLWGWRIQTICNNAVALDDVRDEDDGADDVKDEGGAIKEEVSFGRLKELDEESAEAD